PFLVFFVVWPDAIHVWPKPWSDLSLWIIGAILIWLGLRFLLMRARGMKAAARIIFYGSLIAASAAASFVIATSVYS
ncbi:MAG TPA: hypothetical protein VE221_05110, partial [Sphingomicrobium sp.]|nr:hypothetical protein [Sphingomicrobium sp.]